MELNAKKLGAIIAGLFLIILLCCLGKIGEDVPNEKIVINQYPFTGNMSYWTSPGFRWQWFGTTTKYYKTNQVWFNEINENDNNTVDTYGLDNPGFPITYSDKGKGYVLGSVRIELPTDVDRLNLIQSHYGSENRLMNELVKPTIGKVVLACGPLMTSLEAKRANENAKKIKAEGEAEAYAAKMKVAAGLTPLERATIEKETKIGVAEALSKIQLPKVVMTGNSSNGNAAMDAMGLKMMTDLVNQMSK